MYRAAEELIVAGHAYVDSRAPTRCAPAAATSRRRAATARTASRTPDENLARLRQMRNGELADGAAVLRAKIDMASPNINLRDPVLYRIKRATHHNTGDALVHLPDVHLRASDRGRAREHHALDLHARVRGPAAVLRLAARHALRARPAGAAAAAPVRVRAPQPHLRRHQQAKAEAARRREERRRLGRPAHADARRPAPARLHAGIDPPALRPHRHRKAGGWTDYASLEKALRDDLDPKAPRAIAVLDPVRLVLTNWPEIRRRGACEPCHAPVHPQQPELGTRDLPARARAVDRARRLRGDAGEGLLPPLPGQPRAAEVRLRRRVHRLREGRRRRGHEVLRDPRRDEERHAGRRRGEGQGHDHLARRDDAQAAEVRLYDRLFVGAAARRRRQGLQGEPESRQQARRRRRIVEPALAAARAATATSSSVTATSSPTASTTAPARPVFNRTATLRDTWSR